MKTVLKRSQIGEYSRIVYGMAGDQVKIVSETNVEMTLVEKEGVRFHVRKENSVHIEDEQQFIPIEEEVKQEKKQVHVRKQASVKQTGNPNQISLF